VERGGVTITNDELTVVTNDDGMAVGWRWDGGGMASVRVVRSCTARLLHRLLDANRARLLHRSGLLRHHHLQLSMLILGIDLLDIAVSWQHQRSIELAKAA